MDNISEIREKIEKMREVVNRSWGNDPYEVVVEKNLELDRLIEQYLDAVEKSPHNPPPDSPPIPTIE